MFKLTIECATQDELAALVAKLGGEVTTKPGKPSTTKTSTDASPPAEKSEPAATTSDSPKADAGPDLGDDATFGKMVIDFAKAMKDNGAAAKALFKEFSTADVTINRGAEVPKDRRGDFATRMEAMQAEAALA